MMIFWRSTQSLIKREVVRFLRQKNRIVGALGTPLVFWVLLGSGLQHSFQGPSGSLLTAGSADKVSYLQYFYPGSIILMVLFTAIFSTISIIEDRNEGFLQGVLAAPIPRSSLVLGKLLGGSLLATGQGLLMLLLSPLLGLRFGAWDMVLMTLLLFNLAFGLTGLGFYFAWKLDSSQGFHAIMNLVLMPMWILSGSLFPATGTPLWLHAVMRINPLTYGVASLHRCLFHHPDAGALDSMLASFVITTLFSLFTYLISLRLANKPARGA